MNKNIFSHCVYDVDNRYVDLEICRNLVMRDTFMLTMTDTSNDEETDTMIELFLTKDDLKSIIERLTKTLEQV